MEIISGETANHRRPHCLLVPYPLQGHTNPLLQFAKRLSHTRVAVTLAVTNRWLATAADNIADRIPMEAISDGYDNGTQNVSLRDYLETFRCVGRESLAALLERMRASGRPVDCVVYNPFLPWALAVAKEHRLRAAAFFTQSCCVNAVYYKVCKGEIRVPIRPGESIRIPGVPELGVSDAPSFLSDTEAFPGALELMLSQFDGVETADFVFVNSIYELEKEVIEWLAKFFPLKTIGPTVPSSYLDKRISNDNEYGLSMFKPNDTCLKWLDQHPPRSVILVSFGSIARFESEQMEELACALKMTGKPFLWVVRSLEQSKLPKGFQLQKETEGSRLVVSWCPQLEVLSHGAVGCMVTHCGWNSTLEGLSLGIPMVAIPWWSDQGTNAKLISNMWKVGIRAQPNEGGSGIVSREVIARCIEHVMDDKNDIFWKNIIELKEIVKQAIDDGGSSDKNIQEFASTLRKSLLHEK